VGSFWTCRQTIVPVTWLLCYPLHIQNVSFSLCFWFQKNYKYLLVSILKVTHRCTFIVTYLHVKMSVCRLFDEYDEFMCCLHLMHVQRTSCHCLYGIGLTQVLCKHTREWSFERKQEHLYMYIIRPIPFQVPSDRILIPSPSKVINQVLLGITPPITISHPNCSYVHPKHDPPSSVEWNPHTLLCIPSFLCRLPRVERDSSSRWMSCQFQETFLVLVLCSIRVFVRASTYT